MLPRMPQPILAGTPGFIGSCNLSGMTLQWMTPALPGVAKAPVPLPHCRWSAIM